jgi:hypothetical protein
MILLTRVSVLSYVMIRPSTMPGGRSAGALAEQQPLTVDLRGAGALYSDTGTD